MCVAVPCKVLSVAETQAEVDYEGVPRWVTTGNIPDLAVGEYVTVYAGMVMNRMPAEEAQVILSLFAELAALEDPVYD